MADAAIKDIDEAEEDALLKSDEESDVLAPAKADIDSDDSLLVEATYQPSENIENESNEGSSIDSNESSDESDDAKVENKVLQEIDAIANELRANPHNYDKHVRHCELALMLDDLSIVRNAYEKFADNYPLSSDLWIKYLRLESGLANTKVELDSAALLFRRALADYFSFDIAHCFAAIAPLCSESEDIWNELLGTYGLHVLGGRKLFMLYRRYVKDHATMNAEEKTNAHIQSFKRELKYPLYDMEKSYIEFKVFYNKNRTAFPVDFKWETLIDEPYFKAKEKLSLMMPYEQEIENWHDKSHQQRIDIYLRYINAAATFLDDKNILQTLYERMVAEFCLNDELWEFYIDYVFERDKEGKPSDLQDLPLFQQSSVDINSRALRNCAWSALLYVQRIYLFEELGKTKDDVRQVLENSLSAGFQTPEPVVAIWMEYLTYLRRNTDWKNENECDILRKNFDFGWRNLGQQWGDAADPNCEILKFWGKLEYGPLQDANRGRDLFNTVMESSDNARKAGLWLEFAQLEAQHSLDSARKIYIKALAATEVANLNDIVSNWERLERCAGTASTLRKCKAACLRALTERKIEQQDNHHTKTQKTSFGNKLSGTKRKKTGDSTEVTAEKKLKFSENKPQKTKGYSDEVNEQKHRATALEHHEQQAIDLNKDPLRVFLSNLDYNLTEDDIRKNLVELKIINVDLIRSINGKSRGFGYLELESVANVEKALTLDRRNINGRPLYISSVLRDKEQRQKFKYSDGLEPKKLFIKGLPPDATQAELEQIYSAYGKLKDVRPVYHKSGKFKNIAFVEFDDQSAASKALMATDQMNLRDYTISVAISDPPRKAAGPIITSVKSLAQQTHKRNTVLEKKPRITLIPSAVRKQIETKPANGAEIVPKTNADFQKLFEK